jgi:phage shock protein A
MTTEESIANSYVERKISAGPSRKQRKYDELKTYLQNLKRAHSMLETKVQKLKASLQAYLDLAVAPAAGPRALAASLSSVSLEEPTGKKWQ